LQQRRGWCAGRHRPYRPRRLALGSGRESDRRRQRSAFLPNMRAHGEGGHIVNTASMAGMVNSREAGGQGFAPYPATKYAVVGMSEGLAMEVKPLGIGVSILCPGVVRTNILES